MQPQIRKYFQYLQHYSKQVFHFLFPCMLVGISAILKCLLHFIMKCKKLKNAKISYNGHIVDKGDSSDDGGSVNDADNGHGDDNGDSANHGDICSHA